MKQNDAEEKIATTPANKLGEKEQGKKMARIRGDERKLLRTTIDISIIYSISDLI